MVREFLGDEMVPGVAGGAARGWMHGSHSGFSFELPGSRHLLSVLKTTSALQQHHSKIHL